MVTTHEPDSGESVSKIKYRDEQYSFITPRQTRVDKFKVYDKPFLGNKQFDSIRNTDVGRTIHVDPEVIYRMATLGLDRKMIGGYYGLSQIKFNELCEEYPIIEEVFLMGMTAGVLKVAQRLEEMVDEKQLVPVIFRLKSGGFIEADKLIGKQNNESTQAKVNIYLPDNGRDFVEEDDE